MPTPPSTNSHAPQVVGDKGKGRWTVQVRSFSERQGAESMAKTLRGKNRDAYVMTAVVNGREWHRVCVGRVDSRAEAEKLRETLKADGLTQTVVIMAPVTVPEQPPG